MKLFLKNGKLVRWYSLGAAVVTALLLFLAMPGYFGWWPLLFIALVPLFTAALYLPPFRSACMGMLSGFIYSLLTIHWIVVVLGKYGGLPPWISVPAMVLLSLYMAMYLAVFCLLLSLLAGRSWQKERSVVTLVWTAPLLWVGIDYLRGVLFTGLPWLDLGYGLYSQPVLIQAADLGGHHLISFALVLANGLIVAIIDRQRADVHWNISMERRVLFLACCFLVFIFGYSSLRYRTVPSFNKRALQAQVSVIQGNISQDEKWVAGKKEKTVAIYERLSRQAVAENTTELLVWPETALPFYPQRDPLVGRVMELVQKENLYLLTGAPSFVVAEEDGKRVLRYFNSAQLFDPAGEVVDMYAKQHLVPFGEYVPLRKFLPFLAPLVENVGDFTAGKSSRPLPLGSQLQLGVLICFESIFPGIARDEVAAGANLLVNLTNDAWYGRSSAPYQSMAMSVFRAVETKRSLVRAANTGISAFVDPAGNIIKQTDIFVAAAITAQIPVLEKRTVFVRSGYRFGMACCAFIPGLLLFRKKGG
jgi:apolipoprotein N-acyltransferase